MMCTQLSAFSTTFTSIPSGTSIPCSARTALGSLMKRAFNASSFQHAANSDASWFFCSVIGLSFLEITVLRSWLDSSGQQVFGLSLQNQADGTSSIVPRGRPLIRQKRRQCSRMGSTSQGEREVVSGTARVAADPTDEELPHGVSCQRGLKLGWLPDPLPRKAFSKSP